MPILVSFNFKVGVLAQGDEQKGEQQQPDRNRVHQIMDKYEDQIVLTSTGVITMIIRSDDNYGIFGGPQKELMVSTNILQGLTLFTFRKSYKGVSISR